MRRIGIFSFLLCFVFLPVSAQEENEQLHVRVKGFIDTYHALRTASPNDWMASRSRVRGELSLEKENAGMFVSANAVYNGLLKEQSGFFLREAYLYWSKSYWDIRAGRQIITWGVADAMRITDIVSPMDFTEFLTQDYDDIRIPVNGVRIKYTRPKWNAEAVVIPVSSFYELSVDRNNPWAVTLPGVSMPYSIDIDKTPKKRFKNVEYGGRIRAEAAEYFGEAQDPVINVPVVTRNSTNALIGLDWYAGNDWQLGMQYSHKYISGDLSGISSYRNSGMATVRISKDLLRNTLNLSTFAYIDVANGGIYNRLSADYALTDQIHTLVGYDFFHADKGQFAMYDRNSEVWIKLKYNF